MKVFDINDKVVHYREGLAVITDKILMAGSEYFKLDVLKPNSDDLFVSTANYSSIIREITRLEDIPNLISFIKEIQPEYITNTKQRRDCFKKRLFSGNIKDLAFLSRQLYFFRHPECVEIPVKFGPADVEMLKTAHNNLFDELALTFEKDRNEVEQYFLELLNK
jgi:RNA polymerase-interacting CarD/CdnL/TRCF family regulator